jgi:eukaryotic-like serine/threonine-protein kinase
MTTRELAFRGETSGVIFDAILNREPTSPVRLNPAIPLELERIISKALEKDREIRYQHASDISTDLRRLKRDSTSGSRAVADVGAPKRGRKARFALIALLALLAMGGAYGIYRSNSQKRGSNFTFQNMELKKLTNAGNVLLAALSPDGRYVAYVADEGGKQSLWVRQVAADSNVRILESVQTAYCGLSFSPDGNYLYFSRSAEGNEALTPDGKALQYIRVDKGTANIWEQPLPSGAPRPVTRFSSQQIFSFAWSRDGRHLAFARGQTRADVVLISHFR